MSSLEKMRAEELRSSSLSDSRYAKLESDMERQNQDFIDGHKQTQEQIIQKQDNQLEAISRGSIILKIELIYLELH